METFEHMMDPDGDVVITLNNPGAPFAPWDGASAPAPREDSKAPQAVKFLASSHHLKLASPVFKAALTGNWQEGTVTKGGRRQIETSDWDVEALRITLSILHGRTLGISHTLTLEMLCKIAVLVDYYQCHEAFGFCSSVWIEHLRGSVAKIYGRDLILWLCVSWVFRDSGIFEAATGAAIEQSAEEIRTLELPIPEWVTGTSPADQSIRPPIIDSI
ncbi:hypothetical protein OQA88_4624 [Cercophora sp. LCS_1]